LRQRKDPDHEGWYHPIMIKIDSKTTIQELLKLHSPATTVFIKHRLLCVGCPAQAFHTLEEAARNHGMTIDDLCAAFRDATSK
jgi:hybrid cluster-associated redox disulfide protein